MSASQPQIPPHDEWPSAAKTLSQIGRQLQATYGSRPIPTSAIRKSLEELQVPNAAWIQPSDFAYNLMNAGFEVIAGVNVAEYPIFEQLAWGKYRYLGPHYPYTGPIKWTKRGHAPRKVGHWVSGERTLYEDPRQ